VAQPPILAALYWYQSTSSTTGITRTCESITFSSWSVICCWVAGLVVAGYWFISESVAGGGPEGVRLGLVCAANVGNTLMGRAGEVEMVS